MGPSDSDRGRQLAGSDWFDRSLESAISAGQHMAVIALLCLAPEGARA
jgi:hypothetical protein